MMKHDALEATGATRRRRALPLAATLMLGGLLGAGAAVAADSPAVAADAPAAADVAAAVPSAQQLADPEWVAQGRKRFISACAYCHGQQGEAGKGKSFKDRPGWNPAQIHDVIADGRVRAGNVMPAWKESIPDADIWKLVAYIKSLTPVEGAEPAVKP